MTRLSQLLHLDDGEFTAARAEQESKPLPTPHAPKPQGWGRAMLDYLNAEAPVDRPHAFDALNARPIPHANWDGWLADDWSHLDRRWDNLSDAIARESARACTAYEYSLNVIMASLNASHAELLIDTKAEVA